MKVKVKGRIGPVTTTPKRSIYDRRKAPATVPGAFRVEQGDCIEVLSRIPPCVFHSVVCDPPYALRFMNARWDYEVPSIETWKAIYRVMRPGAYLLAFSAPRTYHRMAVNVEDAGFDLIDQLQWIFASGFPKGQDIGKLIDRKAGATRKVVGSKVGQPGYSLADNGRTNEVYGDLHDPEAECAITEPATEQAKKWNGWNTALKPGHEPIIMARKPFRDDYAVHVPKWRTGALNIDGCRVEGEASPSVKRRKSAAPKKSVGATGWVSAARPPEYNEQRAGEQLGRYPANVIHDGSEEVLAHFPTSKGQQGDLNNHGQRSKVAPRQSPNGIYGKLAASHDHKARQDASDSASRFFFCAKASRKEREGGLEHLQTGEARTYGDYQGTPEHGPKQLVLRKNTHPTVKPIALMRYLCRLVTAPGGTVLDPFAGSGTTGCAAVLEGFKPFLIERDEQWIEVIRCRVEHALRSKP